MRVGFAVVCRDDAVHFHLLGEPKPVRERFVSLSRRTDCWAVLLGRLRYRPSSWQRSARRRPRAMQTLPSTPTRCGVKVRGVASRGITRLVVCDFRRGTLLARAIRWGAIPSSGHSDPDCLV